jgi:3-mercaptopyruvate sulfurtransferase SseA
MTIIFENDNDIIVYALEKVIAYARRTQQIFAAQCVWWLASVIGLEQRLIVHIDNLRTQFDSATHPENLTVIAETIP